MKNILLVLIICMLLTNCDLTKEKSNTPEEKPKTVDGISFDKTKDDPNFKLCNSYVYQYFNDSKGLIYKGGKPKIEEAFFNQYNSEIVPKETGLIRIRFTVNCKGEADRFRLLGMDNDYNELVFDKKITDQLLNITKSLKGWGVKELREKSIDYYQYLIFIINDGIITKILP
jgi:hypothetical protein